MVKIFSKKFLKIVFGGLFALGNIDSVLASSVIKEIRVVGTQRVEKSTIINYINTKVGNIYDVEKQDNALKTLYATSLFEDVSINFINGVLSINVKEAPLVSKVVFSGNKKHNSSYLEKETDTKIGRSFSVNDLVNDVKKIRELYKRIGLFLTTIKTEVVKNDNNTVKVIFNIKEGKKTTVKRIDFVGNRYYRQSDLLSVIRTKKSGLMDHPYDPDILAYDQEMLSEFYNSLGFADFRIISVVSEISKTKESFDVTFTIDEGEKYNFGDITIQESLEDIDYEALRKLIKIKKGELYNINKLRTVIQKISNSLSTVGYANVYVHPEIKKNPENRTVDIQFVLHKLDKSYINQINIAGNLKTEEHVIRREIKIAEGDCYNRSLLENAHRNLHMLNYFSDVSLIDKIVPGGEKDRKNIDIFLKEKATADIGLSAGYSSQSSVSGRVSFTDRNIAGTGKTFSTSIDLGHKSFNIGLFVSDPHFLDSDISTRLGVFRSYAAKSKHSLEGRQPYNMTSQGLRVGGSYNIYEELSHDVEYSLKVSKVDSADNAFSVSGLMKGKSGKNITSSVTHIFTFNYLDNPGVPKNGFLANIEQSFSGIGGDDKYLRHEINANYYTSFILNKLTFKFSAAAGHIKGLGGKILKIADRFSLGDYSLRGFANSGVGPRDLMTKQAIGGEIMYTGNIEASFNVYDKEGFSISTFVFFDAGKVYQVTLPKKYEEYKQTIIYDNSFRTSYGFGFIIKAMNMPIRMDFGFPIKKKPYDDKQRFHIKFSSSL